MSQLFVFFFYLIFFTDVLTVTFFLFLLSHVVSDWTCCANQGLTFLNQYKHFILSVELMVVLLYQSLS